MANTKQEGLLKSGVDGWNKWREANLSIRVDLHKANLFRADLRGAKLGGADLSFADLREAKLCQTKLGGANLIEAKLDRANLVEANLGGAILRRAKLNEANLGGAIVFRADLSGATLRGATLDEAKLGEANFFGADLSESKLIGAKLDGANFRKANLSKANLTGASLEGATIVHTNIDGAIFRDCKIYGISTWDPQGTPASESGGLIITPSGQSHVTVDDLEVAQFCYLLLKSDKIRNVINTIGQKGVLILGRFTPERKVVLDTIREKLRRLDYVPMIFDFDKPTDKDFTETIMTLAGMSRFIIADITNPRSSPLELAYLVPNYMVPFVPIIQKGETPFSMFKDLYGKFDWVLKPLEYETAEKLVDKLEKGIINRALEMHNKLMLRKAEELQTVSLEDL